MHADRVLGFVGCITLRLLSYSVITPDRGASRSCYGDSSYTADKSCDTTVWWDGKPYPERRLPPFLITIGGRGRRML